MKALVLYSVGEALTSLRRGWRPSLLALVTTAAAVFVAAAALLVSINVRDALDRLGTASDLTVYLRANATPGDRERVDTLLARAPDVLARRLVTPDEALRRFAADVPELTSLAASLGENPFPAAFEVRLRPDAAASEDSARRLVSALGATGLVEDVRYDRQVLDRLLTGLQTTRRAGAWLAAILVLAAMLTMTSVLRLSYETRRDEVGILYLVGAPPRAIRGPFVAEGLLQTVAGAAIALGLLAVVFRTFRARYGQVVVEAFGLTDVRFLPWTWIVGLLALSALLGGLAGLGAAWRER